eukprot:6461319-Amphidinium_carterae.1
MGLRRSLGSPFASRSSSHLRESGSAIRSCREGVGYRAPAPCKTSSDTSGLLTSLMSQANEWRQWPGKKLSLLRLSRVDFGAGFGGLWEVQRQGCDQLQPQPSHGPSGDFATLTLYQPTR